MPDSAAPRWLEYRAVDELPPAPTNSKRHDLDALARSVEAFGFIETTVLDERTGLLLGGHGRVEYVADHEGGDTPVPEGIQVREDGRWLIPVTRGWSSRDDEHARAAGIALNRVGERGGWNVEQLGADLDVLAATEWHDAIGWTRDELDDLIASTSPKPTMQPRDEDRQPADRQVQERVKRGELWQLGRHRLLCGDSRDPAHVARVVGDLTVHLAFTSPPYAERRKYDPSSGFRPIHPDHYVDWFEPVQANVAAHLAPDGSWFVNIMPSAEGLDTDLYVFDLVLAHARRWGWHYATAYCWERPGLPQRPARRFKNQWETVYQFARGDWKFRPERVQVPSDVVPTYMVGDNYVGERRQGDGSDAMSHRSAPGMAYPGNRLPTFSGSHEATGHEAAFPVGLPAWFMRAYTDDGDVVLDPFAGSGSTLLAAEREGRTGLSIELSPGYCDVIVDRWERHTGVPAVMLGQA